MMFAIGALVVWLVFRNSTITLDDEGFTYHSAARRISHRWVDIDRFCVVEQRMLFFITTSRYLGWNFTPAYKNYKLLAIPRTVARWVGMTDAMFKPVGFNVPELTKIMNERLVESRTRKGFGRNPSPGPAQPDIQ